MGLVNALVVGNLWSVDKATRQIQTTGMNNATLTAYGEKDEVEI